MRRFLSGSRLAPHDPRRAIERLRRSATVLAGLLALLPASAIAEPAYPTRPIRLIVAYPPGGATDPTARIIGEQVTLELGQQIVVENKPGAAGSIATEYVARAKPDGYTLLFHTSSLTIDPNLRKQVNYAPLKDLASITIPVRAPFFMEVPPSFPANNLAEFIAYAKANPGKVRFGSAGLGSSTHLGAELFMQVTGTKMTHIPYKGSGPVVTALLQNEVQVYFDGLAGSGQFLKAGKFKALGIAAATRSPDFPDVPTFAEQNVHNAESGFWMGIFAPAGTPFPIVQKIASAVEKALATPKVATRIKELGGDVVESDPDKATLQIKTELKKWADLMKEAGIQPQ
jgi:tripartite-type tricarboxylate transporter receptor subunit TctC